MQKQSEKMKKEERGKEMNKKEECKNEINTVLEDSRSMLEEFVDIVAKRDEMVCDLKLLSDKNVALEDENKTCERDNIELLKTQSQLIDRMNSLTVELEKVENIEPYLQEVIGARDLLQGKLWKKNREFNELSKVCDNLQENLNCCEDEYRNILKVLDMVERDREERTEELKEVMDETDVLGCTVYPGGHFCTKTTEKTNHEFDDLRKERDAFAAAGAKLSEEMETLRLIKEAQSDVLNTVTEERDALLTLLAECIQREIYAKQYSKDSTASTNGKEDFI